jgi:hypothetical protein
MTPEDAARTICPILIMSFVFILGSHSSSPWGQEPNSDKRRELAGFFGVNVVGGRLKAPLSRIRVAYDANGLTSGAAWGTCWHHKMP